MFIVTGRDASGAELTVKVFGRDAHDNQLLAKAWRALWYRHPTSPPVLSRVQQVEHEAFLSLLAERAGARVPATSDPRGERAASWSRSTALEMGHDQRMGCLLVILSWISPRFVLVLLWIFSDRLSIAFDSFLLGFVGFLLAPYTTVFYALAYAPVRGVSGIGVLFVALGVLLDLGTWLGGGSKGRRYANR